MTVLTGGLGQGVALGIFFYLIIFLQTGSCNYADILWGQCYAFCLTHHGSNLQKKGDTSRGTIIKTCRRDSVCRWCLRACDIPREDYRHKNACLSHCQRFRPRNDAVGLKVCQGCCQFIHRLFSTHAGTCPPAFTTNDDNEDDDLSDRNGDSSTVQCNNHCQKDTDCVDLHKKCCPALCGMQCLVIAESDSVPPVLEGMEFNTRQDGTTLLFWKEDIPAKVLVPVVYVVRYWCSYTDGVITLITTRHRLKLNGLDDPKGLHPRQACNFMLAAVNVRGSQGFSPLQQYMRDFIKPSIPASMEEGRSRLHHRNKVDLTMHWQPPLYSDLPVSQYLVLWSVPLATITAQSERRRMHNRTISGENLSFTIPDLQPGSIYFVQVRAIVHWKHRVILSDPASLHVETHPMPVTACLDCHNGDLLENKNSTSPIHNINVLAPAFIQSDLKAGVIWEVSEGKSFTKYILTWSPYQCARGSRDRSLQRGSEMEATSHRKEFILYNLQPDCKYQLRIQGVTLSGVRGKSRWKRFTTPPCNQTQGALPDLCPAALPPPPPPVDVTLRFKTSVSCVCQAVIGWKPAGQDLETGGGTQSDPTGSIFQTAPKEPSASLWNIVWGESSVPEIGRDSCLAAKGPPKSVVVYTQTPHEISVPWTETEVCLSYLRQSTHYTAQVLAQSGQTLGQPTVCHFVTPPYLTDCHPVERSSVKSAGNAASYENNTGLDTALTESSYSSAIVRESSGWCIFCTIAMLFFAFYTSN